MKHRPLLRGMGGLAAAYVVAFLWSRLGLNESLWALLRDPLGDAFGDFYAAHRLFDQTSFVVRFGYGLSLTVASLLMPAAYLVRILARARARAGFRDPFERLRAFTTDHPFVTRSALMVGPLLWLYSTARFLSHWGAQESSWAAFAAPALIVVAAQYALLERGLRAFAAPTIREEEIAAGLAHADGLVFRAVAVTRETRAAVGGLGAVSLVMFGASYWLPVTVLARSPVFLAALLGYLALALGGAVLFVRASRIQVGLDGVYISGSARARFVSYREVDEVRVHGSNIDLMRGERRVLRLQLHGEDALRRHALAERIRAAIALAEKQRDEPAVAFVRDADAGRIQRAASGAASYREVTPTRDKLWEVLESPAVDANGRAAAATALVPDSDREERERLRKMAENCAEPSVRARIGELLDDCEEEVALRAVR